MNWIKKQSSFRYSGTPVTRTTMTAHTPLGVFKVYEAISGRVFFEHPFIKRNPHGMPRYDNDPFNEIQHAPRVSCENLKDGINKCHEIWRSVKTKINAY